MRLAYQSCQNNPYEEAPLAPGQTQDELVEETNASGATVGGKSRAVSRSFSFQVAPEPDPTGLRNFGANAKDIFLFTVEEFQKTLTISTERAKLAASAAALDPYWQPLATAHAIEEGGNQVGLDELVARKAANGEDGGQWPFQNYGAYWESRDVPLIRQTINNFCRQAATRMQLDF